MTLDERVAALPPADQAFFVRALSTIEKVRRRQRSEKRSIEFYDAYSNRMREVRRLLNISEKDAAAAYGCTLATYRRYENGATQRNKGMLNFCEKYGITLNWMMSGKGTMLRAATQPMDGESPKLGDNVVRLVCRVRS